MAAVSMTVEQQMQADCHKVITSLANANACTSSPMLAAGLPHTILASTSRHAYQDELLQMVQDTLKAERKTIQDSIAALNSKLEAGNGEVETARASAKEASSAEELAQQAAKTQETAVVAASREEARAKKTLAQGEAAKASIVKVHTEERLQVDQAKFVAEGSLSMLRSGGWEDAEIREASVAAVIELLTKIKAEDVLVAAAPAALGAKPDARGAFDKAVEQGVSDAVAGHVAKIEETLAKGERELEEANAEALGLWAIHEEAKDLVSAAEAELASANEAAKEAEANTKAVEKEMNAKEQAIGNSLEEQTLHEKKLAETDAGVEALERLRVGNYVVEPEVEAPPAADEAMAEAPAEATAATADKDEIQEPAAKRMKIAEDAPKVLDESVAVEAGA